MEGGKEVLFACELRLGETDELGTPHRLFSLPAGWSAFEPAPTGERFLLMKPSGERWPSLTLVENWRTQIEALP